MRRLLGIIVFSLVLCKIQTAPAQELAGYAQNNYGLPSLADLVEKLQPVVVNISTTHQPEDMEINTELNGIVSTNPKIEDYFNPKGDKQLSLGSGFIIDKDGYIITNNHVIDKAEKINVTLADNKQFEAKLIGKDNKTDIALIKIDAGKELPFAKMGNSDKIRVGDWIVAIGNPFGLGGSVTAGIVSAKSRDIESGPYDNFIQTDASINQGSSGGPMFNLNGEVIGINSAIFSTSGGSMGIGFAVPINLADFVIRQLKENGTVERGWIGIKIQPNSADIAASVGLKDKQGVVVSSVSENSSAKKAGIEAGDIIIGFEGQEIDNTKNLSRMVAETDIGKTVELELWRNKQSITIRLPVELMQDDEPQKNEEVIQINDTPENGDISPIEELGISVSDLSPEMLNRFSLNNNLQGVVITNIVAGSDAELKGLKSGDVIAQIDKKTIVDTNDVKTYVREAKMENNRPVLLQIKDGDVPHLVAVKLKKNE